MQTEKNNVSEITNKRQKSNLLQRPSEPPNPLEYEYPYGAPTTLLSASIWFIDDGPGPTGAPIIFIDMPPGPPTIIPPMLPIEPMPPMEPMFPIEPILPMEPMLPMPPIEGGGGGAGPIIILPMFIIIIGGGGGGGGAIPR